MVEGTNPVILANKIFIGNPSLHFESTTKRASLTLRLGYTFKGSDRKLGEGVLDLTAINSKFLDADEKYKLKESLGFKLEEGEAKLVFNIFVERGKVELDRYVTSFKEN